MLTGILLTLLGVTTSPAVSGSAAGTGRTEQVPFSTELPRNGAVEQWAGARSALFDLTPRGDSSARSGGHDAAASDGRALALTIPAGAGATPANAAEVVSDLAYLYGTFTARLRTADCSAQPATGAVTGVFTYANDGSDRDRDGLPDNAEIDVEVLCAQPWVVYLSIWTEYRDSDGAQRRVTRAVDLRTGRILSTAFFTSFESDGIALAGAENDTAAIPVSAGLDTSTAYHVFRITWTAHRVLFTVDEAGRTVPLWDYRGPWDRIPHRPSQFLVNLWHTSDWSPIDAPAAVAAPSAPLTTWVDWVGISSGRRTRGGVVNPSAPVGRVPTRVTASAGDRKSPLIEKEIPWSRAGTTGTVGRAGPRARSPRRESWCSWPRAAGRRPPLRHRAPRHLVRRRAFRRPP